MTAREVVQRARSLAGCHFRPQGRDPALGLDCIGLVMRVFAIPAERVRRDYRLRDTRPREFEEELGRFFVPAATSCSGDVMLCQVGNGRLHLAIHCGGSFVHADAGLRKVVETPGEPSWPVTAIFRHPDLIQD